MRAGWLGLLDFVEPYEVLILVLLQRGRLHRGLGLNTTFDELEGIVEHINHVRSYVELEDQEFGDSDLHHLLRRALSELLEVANLFFEKVDLLLQGGGAMVDDVRDQAPVVLDEKVHLLAREEKRMDVPGQKELENAVSVLGGEQRRESLGLEFLVEYGLIGVLDREQPSADVLQALDLLGQELIVRRLDE